MASQKRKDGKENVTSDWRDKKSINDCVYYLSKHKMWHDVTFSISGKHLLGHRLILSLRSPVFEAMFYGPAADKNEVIEMTDMEYDIFDDILRYMYTDTCKLTGDNVLPMLYGAKKYSLPQLVESCSLYLEQSITSDNVCALYERAKMYDMNSLVKSCFDLMIKESNAVCKTDSSVCLSYDSLLEFLSSENLTGDELVYFKFVDKWATQKCITNSIESSPENKRVVLGDIAKKISYQLIKVEDFARIVVPTNILMPEEQSQIFQYIATRDKSCIEKFAIPPRLGFLVSLDTGIISGPTSPGESFCFQFSCNTNVRLIKLFPLRLNGKRDFGKKDVKAVNIFRARSGDRTVSSDILDDSAAIAKDIGFEFEANFTYTVEILIRTEQYEVTKKYTECVHRSRHRERHPYALQVNGDSDAVFHEKVQNIALTSNNKFTNGSFSCTILKIPRCVEVVEFKILPK